MNAVLRFRLVCFIIGFFIAQNVSGQLNIRVGYGLAFFDSGINDEIMQDFNLLKEAEFGVPLSREFGPLNIMHGINVGARFSLTENHAVEAGWENLNNSKEALGENTNMGLFSQSLFYSSNQFHAAYQFRSGLYGFGLGVGTNRLRIKDEITGSDVKKEILSQNQAVLRFNLSLYFEGSRDVSFSIQPFFHYMLDRTNLDPLRAELGLTGNSALGDRFSRAGINFIFYNGPRS